MIALVLAATVAPAGARTEDEASSSTAPIGSRPKTCLVLSGGGARGIAHVGVLQVLEQERVPIDCIIGTSMGAIVGGLYASGLDANRIEQVLLGADWRDLFSDRPARREIPFRRKQDDNLPLFRFEFGLNRTGFVLPTGLIAGQKFDFLLRELALPATGIREFDRLAIPFRAVSTDLVDGSAVVLAEGDLADAIRASSSVPGVFTPVEIDGRTLVDGGLVANLPIGVALESGAERIIAIDVSAPLGDPDADRSVVGIAMRTVGVLTMQNVAESRSLLRARDVLIEPDLTGVRSTSLDAIGETLAIGVEAGRAAAPRLRELSVSEDDYAEWRAQRARWRAEAATPVRLDAVKISGLQRVDPRIVRRRVRTRPGDQLDIGVLSEDLAAIYRLGDFERIKFGLETQENQEKNVLAIDAHEKSWGPNFLRFGMGLQADFEGRAEFTVLANFVRTRVNALGAEWLGRLAVGEVNGALVEFYQPLDFDSYWFVAPRVEAERRNVDVFEADGSISEFRVDRFVGGFDLGIQFRAYGELRAGIRGGQVRLRERTAAGTPTDESVLGAWSGSLIVDRLDNANFPRWGSFFSTQVWLSREALGADDEYDRLDVTYLGARSFGRNTFVGRLRWGSGLGSEIPFYDHFRLGGFLELSGLPPGALRGPELGFAQIVYYREIGRLPGAIGGGLYVGISAEAGNVWDTRDDASLSDLRPAGLVWAGVDSMLGPVYVGYGRTTENQDSFYLALGQVF